LTGAEGLRSRSAEHGSAEEGEIVFLSNLIRAATADYVTSHPDPRHAMALLMTALPMYAGSLFATLMFTGDVGQQDTARMAKMVAKNFREGIKVGVSRAHRVAQETGFDGVPS
jgi:hypothetical protein